MPIENIEDIEAWNTWEEKNTDPYGKCCVDVAREVMRLMDEKDEFECDDLILQADKKFGRGGITGFQAGCVAEMIVHCHSRGEEFRKKWNKGYGVEEDKKGVVNPAILTFKG